MRLLKYVVITMTLSAMIFAQSQANPPSPAQAQPSQTQPARGASADRSSSSTGTAYSRTFTATIVNAECSQASILSSASATESKESTASSTSSSKENRSVYDKQREVLKHCRANDKTTAFAVLTDDGNFYKLDESGNGQVTSQAGSDKEKKKNLKNMRVTVTGTPQGDTLKVESLAKTDKPFGAA